MSIHGEHGQTSILELLDLQLCQCVWVVTKAEGVEGACLQRTRTQEEKPKKQEPASSLQK